MATPGGARVGVKGLTDLRRDLRKVEQQLPRQLTQTMKEAAEPVARKSAALAPRRTGKLAASIKAGARGTTASVRSRLPYANVIAWGGTTGRGHKPGVGGSGSVKIAASRFPEKAADAEGEGFMGRLADGIEQLLGRNGFG